MFFNFALFSSLSLVPVVLAVPAGSGARVSHGREGRQSQPNNHLEQTTRSTSNTVYSYNWAGAVLEESEETFTSIIGTFTVPTPSGSTGTSAAAWVGIDGETCKSAILQTGVQLTVSSDGPQYIAWYEFYPQAADDFTELTISAGDVIKLNVTASSAYSGTATIENVTKGQVASKSLTSSAPLCGQDAEWIVEDYVLNSEFVPFANFGTITFTDAEATGMGTYTPSNAAYISEIEQNNQVLTSTSTSGSTVTVKHV